MEECIVMLYFEVKSCFFFINNNFTFNILLLQKDDQIIFFFWYDVFKTLRKYYPEQSSLSPKICHCNGSGVSSIILMCSFLVFEVTTGHITRSWVGFWSSSVLFFKKWFQYNSKIRLCSIFCNILFLYYTCSRGLL